MIPDLEGESGKGRVAAVVRVGGPIGGGSVDPSPAHSLAAPPSPAPSPSRASSPAGSTSSSFSACSYRDSRESSAKAADLRSRHSSSSYNVPTCQRLRQSLVSKMAVFEVRSPPAIPSRRVHVIRRESQVKEIAKSDMDGERLLRSADALNTSLEDFGLDEEAALRRSTNRVRALSVSLTEPISVLTHFVHAPAPSSTPSPTRSNPTPAALDKQCFSPSTQQLVHRNIAFSPSPRSTPSPNRKHIMRSLSPIAVLNHRAGIKRRHEEAGPGGSADWGSPKRPSWAAPAGSPAALPSPRAAPGSPFTNVASSFNTAAAALFPDAGPGWDAQGAILLPPPPAQPPQPPPPPLPNPTLKPP